ncbi:unnamed protein product [Amoebophrya sp. A120]|nr:unnamed protein product [Amoebophrya sp. A120]|eukprot:GSA120T00006525001.1
MASRRSRTGAGGEAEASAPAPRRSRGAAPSSSADSNNIKVCIRVRPFIEREKGEKCIVEMPMKDVMRVLDEDGNAQTFNYDRCYWSHSREDPQNGFADQNTLMSELGMELLNNSIRGYNDTLFAYGQTGSGKTWSVIGGKDMNLDAGLLPRMVNQVFQMLAQRKQEEPDWTFQIRVSYLEIYNDKLRDLLNPIKQGQDKSLEVRQHPKFGIYVPGLTESASTSSEEVMKLMDFGMKARSVAATSMNDRSSRSHCIFTVSVTQIKGDNPEKPLSLLRSKINLVDLAGSERQKKTNASGDRLKEGAQINQSLTNLALVIHALAKSFTNEGKNANDFVPFRNSKLTYLLQESLVGNSKTVMIAAVSPARSNYDETMSTLRFANSVKEIQTKAIVNQEADADIIAQLKAEIKALKGEGGAAVSDAGTQEQLAMLNDLVGKYGSNFRQEVEAAQQMEQMRQQALVDMGLSGKGMATAMNMNPNTPYLMNVADDPSLTGCLVYFIPINEEVTIGSDASCTIKLNGLGIAPVMCQLVNFNHTRVHVKPVADPETGKYGRLLRNGRAIGSTPTTLEARDRFMIGRSFIFKLVVPLQKEISQSMTEEDAIGDHLAEIMDNTSEEFMQAKAFVEAVASRIGEEAANNFLASFAQAIPLVQEGNDISAELRKRDNLLLRLDVVTDVMGYEGSEPMLCVRLWKKEPAAAKMKRVFKRVVQNKKMNKHVFNIAAYLTGIGTDPNEDLYTDAVIDGHRCQLIALWSWRSFLVRLAGMREAYDDFKSAQMLNPRLASWSPTSDNHDPWGEVSYLDVRQSSTLNNLYQYSGSDSSSSSSSGNLLPPSTPASAREVIDGLRQRLAIAEKELLQARQRSELNFLPEKRKSKKPQEAKMLAQELLEELRVMKAELHAWK